MGNPIWGLVGMFFEIRDVIYALGMNPPGPRMPVTNKRFRLGFPTKNGIISPGGDWNPGWGVDLIYALQIQSPENGNAT